MTEPDPTPPPEAEEVGERLVGAAVIAACDVPMDLDARVRLADTISRAGVLPKHLRGNPGNILAICFAAHSLQIPLWPALGELVCIEGKIGMSANLMRALWLRAGHRFRVIEREADHATVEVTRRGEGPYPVTFSVDDAIAAGLCTRDKDGVIRARDKENRPLPWEKYTKALLVARATSVALREVGADVLFGMGYTPEELTGGDPSSYLEAGSVVHVATTVAESPEQVAARVGAAQAEYDAAVAEIDAAADDAALRGLWKGFHDRGIVRASCEGREHTLEQLIIAARERRAGQAEASAAGQSAEAGQDAAGEDPPCPECGGEGADGACATCGLIGGPVINR